MEDVDDDFGDLYADVEVEASSAMNVALQFSQLQRVSDDTGKQEPASNDNEDTSSGGADNDEDDNDDDDDLDIVLNSDDDSVRHGDGFTIARNNTNLRGRELEDEDNDNLGTEEFMGGRSYLRSHSAAYGSDLKGSGSMTAFYLSPADNEYYQQMGSRSVVPQRGERFSLPRSRNILDVNIDVFEQKPWKHPGADITDYFNFGFNEDSWKLYCNQVDEYRHRAPAFEPIRLIETKGYEGGFEHEMVAHGIWGESESTQRKGQAIQVEDSIVERLSSMDVRRKMDRDSDVIQVTIVDSSVPEASNHGGVNGGDCTDHLTFSSESEDSVEGNNLEMDIYSSKRSSSSKPISENHEVHQISNVSGGTDEATKTSNNTKEMAGEEDTCTTESFKVEKSPKIYCKRKPGENRYHERQTSPLYNNRNRRDSKHKHHDDDPGDKRKHADHRYHARCNSRVHNNGTRKYFKPKPRYENDIKPHEHKYHSVYSQRAHIVPKAKAYHEHNESFSMSDIEGAYHLHSTVGHKKRYDYERLHDFDSYYEENIPYSSKWPSDNYEYWYERYGTLKTDQSVSSEEDEYYGEERRYIEDNKMMARDWYLNERDYNQPFINIGDDDELFFEHEYTDDIREEKFTSFSYNGRERDDFEHGYEKHVSDTRWKFRGNMSGVCSAFSELNNQSFTSRSSEESHINNGRWHGNIMPRNCLHGRRGRSRGYDGSLGHYSQLFDRENYTIDIDGRVEMQWEEDEAILRHEDAKRCDDRTSFNFEKIARHKKLLNNLQSLKGRKYRFNKTYGERRERSCRNLLDSRLVDGEVKYSEKHKKPKLMDSYSCLSDKVAKAVVTKAIDRSLDIGEGQNLTKEVKVVPAKHDINESCNRNRNTGFVSTRILEAMAKMEKRRTRFNEPITTTSKENVDSMMKHTVDMVLDTALNKQQRPARKRRWGGS